MLLESSIIITQNINVCMHMLFIILFCQLKIVLAELHCFSRFTEKQVKYRML